MEYLPELQQALFKNEWVVYCKPPFNGAKGVIEYLSRYTFKTAISNHRIIAKHNSTVTFNYKDYRHAGTKKVMTLSKSEFIRRFTLHILPKGFQRIRHYGILSGRLKSKLLGIKPSLSQSTWENFWKIKGLDVNKCPKCKKGKLIHIRELPKRGPPNRTGKTAHF